MYSKTMKSLLASLFALMLAFSFAFAPLRALAANAAPNAGEGIATSPSEIGSTSKPIVSDWQQTFVRDHYGLFTKSQAEEWNQKACEMAAKYGVGCYLVVVDDLDNYSSARSYAKDYFKYYTLGCGNRDSAILFLLAVDSRDYVTITYGGGVDVFTDVSVDKLESHIVSYLKKNNWVNAATSYYDDCESVLAYLAANGKPANDYYANDYPNPDENNFGIEECLIIVAIGLILGAIIARVIVNREKAAMLTAVKKSEAGDYLDRSSLTLTEATDEFVNTTLVATPRVQESSGGGGGGGRFDGGFGGFGHSSIDVGGFGGSSGGKF